MSEKDPGSQGYDFKVAQDAKSIYGWYKGQHEAEQRANAQVDEGVRALDNPVRSVANAQAIKEGSGAVERAAWAVQGQAGAIESGRKHFEANEEQYKINAGEEMRVAREQ